MFPGRDDLLDWETRAALFIAEHATVIAITCAAIFLAPPILAFFRPTPVPTAGQQPAPPDVDTSTIMSAPPDELPPPRNTPFTLAELRPFDGSDEALPIYVSIKGTVFDVTRRRDVYGPPTGSYRVFAGRDASRAFGLSSTREEDASPDWSTLSEKERGVMEDWWRFFRRRYPVVGRVVDMPAGEVREGVWPTDGVEE